MPIIIPLRNDLPHFDLQVVLDNVTYTLEFNFNTREKSWYMNIMTEGGDYIIMSVKFVLDFPLGRRTANSLRPPGVLLAIDTSGAKAEATYNPDTKTGDLGDRVILMYISKTELPITA